MTTSSQQAQSFNAPPRTSSLDVRILDVARHALEEDGKTSLNQIAQRAGVGSLDRNFPTREDLGSRCVATRSTI